MFIEKISETEKNIIDEMRGMGIPSYDPPSQGFVSCRQFLIHWEMAKQAFFHKIFKDKLILKKRICVTLEDDDLLASMNDIIYSDDFMIMKKIVLQELERFNDLSLTKDNTGNSFLGMLTKKENLLYYLFSASALINNRYEGETIHLNLPNGSTFQLSTGCKVMKALGKLTKSNDQAHEIFEKIRIKQSQIMNEAKIEATLCLSIHPLDYMTASYNANNWSSCMNWDDGDYRRGVIEMMNSQFVVVAYLESDHDFLEFDAGDWNSKKWREFIICSKEGIFGIKGYPYWNHDIEDEALKWLRELYAEHDIYYSDKVSSWCGKDPVVDNTINARVRMDFFCGPAMYNDFYAENTYHGMLSLDCKDLEIEATLDYSGVSECIICGHVMLDENTHDLCCETCVPKEYCHCCGEEIYGSDIQEFDGYNFCSYCFSNKLHTCDSCDEILHIDEDADPIEGLTFVIGNEQYNDIILTRDTAFKKGCFISRTVCDECAREVFVDGIDEISYPHMQYYDGLFTSRDIVPLSRIRDIDALNIPDEVIENYKERLKERNKQMKNNTI